MYYVCENYQLFDRFYHNGNLSSCKSSNSIIDLFRYLADRPFVRDVRSYELKDLRLKYHSSHSINDHFYNIYLITVDCCGKENYLKKYHLPQALCYLVELID